MSAVPVEDSPFAQGLPESDFRDGRRPFRGPGALSRVHEKYIIAVGEGGVGKEFISSD